MSDIPYTEQIYAIHDQAESEAARSTEAGFRRLTEHLGSKDLAWVHTAHKLMQEGLRDTWVSSVNELNRAIFGARMDTLCDLWCETSFGNTASREEA